MPSCWHAPSEEQSVPGSSKKIKRNHRSRPRKTFDTPLATALKVKKPEVHQMQDHVHATNASKHAKASLAHVRWKYVQLRLAMFITSIK